MLQQCVARVAEQIATSLVHAGDERSHAVLNGGVQKHRGVMRSEKPPQFTDIGGFDDEKHKIGSNGAKGTKC